MPAHISTAFKSVEADKSGSDCRSNFQGGEPNWMKTRARSPAEGSGDPYDRGPAGFMLRCAGKKAILQNFIDATGSCLRSI